MQCILFLKIKPPPTENKGEKKISEVKFLFEEVVFKDYLELLRTIFTVMIDNQSTVKVVKHKDILMVNLEDNWSLRDGKVVFSTTIWKAKQSYKISEEIMGIYMLHRDDDKFYFLDAPAVSYLKGKKCDFSRALIISKMVEHNIVYDGESFDLRSKICQNIDILPEVIKPNSCITHTDQNTMTYHKIDVTKITF